ncbi:MAG TPA: sigma-70 family RNA polymerase sigma factor [Gaiellaceae bacterium]|nr:sigma-70 family RNA polymerase sigma factor [Gaiellaceae bacterium]
MTDPAAEAFERHYGNVYRFVRRHGTGREEAEDLTQEVFAAAVSALDEARVESPPPLRWLYTVAQRRLIDAARRGRLRPVTTAAYDEEPGADEAAYGWEVAEALARAVAELPDSQRRVVVAKLWEGRSLAEIAGRLGTSEAACKMRLARGLARLRDRLKEEGVEP